jgi:hypothetical protein
MPIIPDNKNWTWVTERACPECGFDASRIVASDVPALLRANIAAWPAVLARENVRMRPDDSTWSPLEYAAHVRDTIRITHERMLLALSDDDPLFANWDQDEAAVLERYNEQDPAVVSTELAEAAAAFAHVLEAVPDDAWGRPARRSDGSKFTVETLVRYFIHDPIHHLWDVRPE